VDNTAASIQTLRPSNGSPGITSDAGTVVPHLPLDGFMEITGPHRHACSTSERTLPCEGLYQFDADRLSHNRREL